MIANLLCALSPIFTKVMTVVWQHPPFPVLMDFFTYKEDTTSMCSFLDTHYLTLTNWRQRLNLCRISFFGKFRSNGLISLIRDMNVYVFVKRDNISYNISLLVRRAIFLQVLKKPYFVGLSAHFPFLSFGNKARIFAGTFHS